MKKINARLIVSDFDGTLANSKNEVPGKVVKAIEEYERAGGIFAVCSGRILSSIMPRVKEIGLGGLVVACQGSVIADLSSGEIIRNVSFTGGQTAEICGVFEELETNAQIYFNGGYYSDLPVGERHLKRYEEIVGGALHSQLPLKYVALNAEKEGVRFNKVATLCYPVMQAELYKKIRERLGDRYDVTCSAAVLVEVSPLGETKGKALRFLAERYGVPVENTVAIGDNLNDLSMIEAAGVGVAVANGVEELKRAADYVSVTNDECAVADVIAKFGFEEGE